MQDVLELMDIPDVDGVEDESIQHMRLCELVPRLQSSVAHC